MPQRVLHTFRARRALLRHLVPRYRQASPPQKTLLLDVFVEWTGYTRKYAIELLNHGDYDQQTIQRRRLPQYRPQVQRALFLAWKATHHVCAKRLVPSLPSLVALLEGHGRLQLTEEERCQLLAMSVSTAERFLRIQRKARLYGLSTTTPGPRCKSQIPVRIFRQWEEDRPGFVEADLVAHCGDHLDGSFLYTMTLADLATGWTECIPLLEKSAGAVLAALSQARKLFPFPLLGINTDSGSEFLNEELIAYCEQEQLTFTHGRPGVKNDQCHVEQKNGAVVRGAVGCARLVGVQAYLQLREVYRALRLVVNCFQPSLKLQARVPKGGQMRRVYDAAQTPLQRLLAFGVLPKDQQRDLRERVQQIDPLALSEYLDALRHALLCGACLSRLVAADVRTWPQLRFSLDACTSVPLLPPEEGPARTAPQEAPSSSEESLNWPHTPHDPFARAWEEPWPPELIQAGHVEPRSPEAAVSAADQSSAQAQPLPVPASGTSNRNAGERETGHCALTTVEQAMSAYLQEMRACGRDPKTLQWHQTSLGALRRYLWRQFHLTDIGSLTGTCLQAWVNDLPYMLSARTGAARTVSTIAAYARSARAFCNWLVRQGYVPETVFPKGAVPKAQRGLPKPVEPGAFILLLRACRLQGSQGGHNAGMTARNRAILWLLLDTGLQVSELCDLRLADVDRAGGTVTVRGKRERTRTLPLSAGGQLAVGAYLDQVRLTPAWEPTVPGAQDRLLLTERRHPLTKNSLTLLCDTLNPLEGDELLGSTTGLARLRGDLLCKQWLSRWFTQTTGFVRTQGRACPTTPFPGSERAGTEIREGTRELQVDAEGILVHIDRADEIAVAFEAASAARPVSASGLVTMPAAGTAARGASFRAGETRDAGLCAFVGQVVDVAPVLPQGHASVVMPPTVAVAHAMRVANEETPDLVLDTEVEELPRGLVPEIAYPSLGTTTDFVLRSLEFLPAPGVLFAPTLLFGEPPELLAALPLEGANAAPGDNERLARAGGHGGQVDFPQVNGRLDGSGSLACLRNFHTNVQLEAPVPHQRASPGMLRQVEWKDEGGSALAHRQDDAPFALQDCLSRPVDGVEPLGAPGVLHAQLRVFLTHSAGGLNVGEEGVHHHLHGLTMQGIAPFGGPLQLVASWPRSMGYPSSIVRLHTTIPHAGSFHLHFNEAAEERKWQVVQAIDAHGLHIYRFFSSTRKMVTSEPSGSLSSRPLQGRDFPLHLFKRLSQRAGFTRAPICPSMLRDTYATRFLQAGGELAALQEQLGVTDLVAVKRYQRFCEGKRREIDLIGSDFS